MAFQSLPLSYQHTTRHAKFKLLHTAPVAQYDPFKASGCSRKPQKSSRPNTQPTRPQRRVLATAEAGAGVELQQKEATKAFLDGLKWSEAGLVAVIVQVLLLHSYEQI